MLVMCTMLGLLGAHQFYAGHIFRGLLMLVLTVMGWGLIITVPWTILDWVLIVTGQFHDRLDNRVAW